jgi:hypothetical protein
MQRHLLGVLAVVLLAVGVVMHVRGDAAVAGTCLRIGAVLALLWLAMPQLREMPTWILGALGLALLLVLRWPKLLWAMLPLAVVLWLLRPRGVRRASRTIDPRD